jgi:hypothetical protein
MSVNSYKLKARTETSTVEFQPEICANLEAKYPENEKLENGNDHLCYAKMIVSIFI